MSSPISGGSPRRLELVRDTSFKDEPDQGKNLELAMMTVIFKKLQDAGYVPAKAKLATRLAVTPGLSGKTYEARLRELVKDADGNGQLDIDLEALAKANMLVGAPTADELANVLSGREVGGFSDAFVRGQASASGFLAHGAWSEKAVAVNEYAGVMVLTTEQDRATADFVAGAGARAAKSPDEARAVRDEALNAATVLAQKGDVRRARELLEGTSAALAGADRLDDAAATLGPLTREPLARARQQTVQDIVSQLQARGAFDEQTGCALVEGRSGAKIELRPSRFVSTVGDVAGVRLEQLALRQRMEKALGRKVDPSNVDDARAYFSHLGREAPTAEVSGELQRYLRAYFKHAGEGVTWPDAIPPDERGRRVGELLDGHPSDDAGRKIVDREGFAYLTEHLLRGVKDANGKERFHVQYATRPGHVISGVVDASSRQVFTVNNDSVSAPIDARKHDVRAVIARELAGDGPTLISIADSQSGSRPLVEPDGFRPAPKVGALIWDGQKLVGTVSERAQRAFIEVSTRHDVSYAQFALELAKLPPDQR